MTIIVDMDDDLDVARYVEADDAHLLLHSNKLGATIGKVRLATGLADENAKLREQLKQVCEKAISLDNELRDSQLSIPTPCAGGGSIAH
jgi:hypothetical protein